MTTQAARWALALESCPYRRSAITQEPRCFGKANYVAKRRPPDRMLTARASFRFSLRNFLWHPDCGDDSALQLRDRLSPDDPRPSPRGPQSTNLPVTLDVHVMASA